jgi:hypothetical protein
MQGFAKWHVAKMAVQGGVDIEDEIWEEHMETIHCNKTAALLMLVSMQTI